MKRLLQCAVLFLLAAPGTGAYAASEVRGFMIADGVTGRDATPHGWMEQKVYIQSERTHTGTGTTTMGNPAGWFSLKQPGGLLPGGPHTFFSLIYDAITPFDYVSGIMIPDGTAVLDHQSFKTSAHYSVMYNVNWTDWDESPWVAGTDFYQTFIATSGHVTRIATKLADKTPEYTGLLLNYAIYKANDSEPSTWERISPVRSRFLSSHTDPIIHIFSVPYRSNEVVLVPEGRYAVRFWRDESSQSKQFVICARKDDGTGYEKGELYVDGKARPDLDVYAFVSGGAANTVVNHAPIGDFEFKEFLGWNTQFGQTFTASGVGLAAVDVIYARQGGQPLDIPITFQLFDKPGGKAIGPAKTIYGAPGSFQARAAAFWSPKEAPIRPGQSYFIVGKSEGLNVWKANEDIPGGDAWLDGETKAPADLVMSIAEYKN